MATLEDLAFVRDYVGMDDPDDSAIYALIAETGSAAAAAQRILLRRRSDLLNGPASFSVTGYSENNTETIKALSASLDTLEALTGVGGDDPPVTRSQMVRADRCRR